MKRRYRIVGPIGQQDPDTGLVVQHGGVLTLDEKDARTVGLVGIGAIALEADQPDSADTAMPCPLCTEQGQKRVPKLATAGELEAHYTDKHPGFVVPTFTERGEQ